MKTKVVKAYRPVSHGRVQMSGMKIVIKTIPHNVIYVSQALHHYTDLNGSQWCVTY